jgi:hypothetical protein
MACLFLSTYISPNTYLLPLQTVHLKPSLILLHLVVYVPLLVVLNELHFELLLPLQQRHRLPKLTQSIRVYALGCVDESVHVFGLLLVEEGTGVAAVCG